MQYYQLIGLLALAAVGARGAEQGPVRFHQEPGRVRIEVGGRPFATYVFGDPQIRRPYFAHVQEPGGLQVTRRHPPVAGKDATDHETMHPGIWLAFGDLGGADFWRNKGRVEQEAWIEPPLAGPDRGQFVMRNRYVAEGGRTVCRETCRVMVAPRPAGTLLLLASEFRSDNADFSFGDQEEMGLGLRVATPLAVKQGGRITNSDGLVDEKGTWGKPAAWCDYSGMIEGRRVGLCLMPDPKNFRRSWFHARDYGLLVANPFGQKSLGSGEPSRLVVRKGEPFRLRFGVLVYGAKRDPPPDLAAAYADFLQFMEGSRGWKADAGSGWERGQGWSLLANSTERSGGRRQRICRTPDSLIPAEYV